MPGLPNINRGVSMGRMFPSSNRASNINYGGYVSGAGVGAVSRANRRALKKRAVLVQDISGGKLVGRNCGCAARNAELKYLAGTGTGEQNDAETLPAWATGTLTNDNIQNYVDLWSDDPSHEVFTDPDSSGFVDGISHWDTSQVTVMSDLFKGNTTFNDDISSWDVSNVTNMASMFMGATSFNNGSPSGTLATASLDSWDVGNVETMESMFEGSAAFYGTGVPSWRPNSCSNFQYMFYDAVLYNQDLRDWFNNEPASSTDFSYMFLHSGQLTSEGDLPAEDTAISSQMAIFFTLGGTVSDQDHIAYDKTVTPLNIAETTWVNFWVPIED